MRIADAVLLTLAYLCHALFLCPSVNICNIGDVLAHRRTPHFLDWGYRTPHFSEHR